MLKPYEEKLQLIKNEVQTLGNDVVLALEFCLKILEKQEFEILNKVEISEKKTLIKSNEIDNIIISTLALYKPEARDLRRLVVYLKITNEIVRTAANVKDFAKLFKKAYSKDLAQEDILEQTI